MKEQMRYIRFEKRRTMCDIRYRERERERERERKHHYVNVRVNTRRKERQIRYAMYEKYKKDREWENNNVWNYVNERGSKNDICKDILKSIFRWDRFIPFVTHLFDLGFFI